MEEALVRYRNTSLAVRLEPDHKGRILAMRLLYQFWSEEWITRLLSAATATELSVADNDGNNLYHLSIMRIQDKSGTLFTIDTVITTMAKFTPLLNSNHQGFHPWDFPIETHLFEVYPPVISLVRVWGSEQLALVQEMSNLDFTSTHSHPARLSLSLPTLKGEDWVAFYYRYGSKAFSSTTSPQLIEFFNWMIRQPDNTLSLELLWDWISPQDYHRLDSRLESYLHLDPRLVVKWPRSFWQQIQSAQYPHYTIFHHWAITNKELLYSVPGEYWGVVDVKGQNVWHYLFRSEEHNYTLELIQDLEWVSSLLTPENISFLAFQDQDGRYPHQVGPAIVKSLDGYSLYDSLIQHRNL